MSRVRMLLVGLLGLVGTALLGACGYDATKVPEPEAPTTSSSAAPATPVECDDATRSYAPADDRAAAVEQLARPGRLVVGVSGDTYQLGFTNPVSGDLEGFDIDFARAVAQALGVTPEFRVISAAQRIPLLESGEIDMVARNMTVNCARWTQVAFSAVYYNATQKVLVRSDVADAGYQGPQDLAGKRVCAPAGTTSVANIKAVEPDVVAVEAPNHTSCLIRFQAGEVDAVTGDDTVLAGLAAQDPYAVVPVQDKLTDEPYGLAFNQGDVDLVRFTNAVLDRMRTDGRWADLYARWLEPELEVPAAPPTPAYGR